MRDDQRFEIERAFDVLPHVVGASWAVTWFRLSKIRDPTAPQFREKVIEYMCLLEPLYAAFPDSGGFVEISRYVARRRDEEVQKVMQGLNDNIEKRYRRYLDYG